MKLNTVVEGIEIKHSDTKKLILPSSQNKLLPLVDLTFLILVLSITPIQLSLKKINILRKFL